MPTRKLWIPLLAGLLWQGMVTADELALKPDHPKEHVVVKGDTLWDISSKFLQNPWRWPEIWRVNPEIKNPHLIYPGDVIQLVYIDGKPVLKVKRGRPTIKLSPKARATQMDTAIPAIQSDVISHFLEQPRILTDNEIENSGYIFAAEEEKLISGAGSLVYARDLPQHNSKEYAVYRVGKTYRNPNKRREVLGYEAVQVAKAKVVREGDPVTLKITKSFRETMLGDKLLPLDTEGMEQNFFPHAPSNEISAEVISIFDGVSRAGQYQTVVLNFGSEDGAERGHVLAVRQTGKTVRDENADRRRDRNVQLPDQRAALLMVYQIYDRVSYALVMDSDLDIRVGDSVTIP